MPHRKLIARLQAVVGVSGQDQAKLASMPHSIKTLNDGEYVLHQGDAPARCAVVMTGFLARQKVVSERNQISSFYVPGDMPDLHTLHLPVMDHDLCSVGASTVAFITHSHLREMLEGSPGLTNAFWRETLIHAAIYREWVENLGSRQALPRLAHLLCELAARLEMVGLLDDDSFRLPFTQQDFADACGLSTVHVNRTIQELRRRDLIAWQGPIARLLQREELEMIADFSPGYLHVLKTSVAPAAQASGNLGT
jgi:CRP-like cAMP-binding protein